MNKNKRILLIGGSGIFLLVLFFLLQGSGSTGAKEIVVDVSSGQFVVDINTTGSLEAKNSISINGPSSLRKYRIYQVNIQDIIDEGSYVKKGQYIARLDPSELTTRIKDTQLELDEQESRYVQTKLDTALQMREARDKLINLKYEVEAKELVLEQSQYEPPATIKKAEIEVEKAKRAYEQAKENYRIKEQQNIAKMREVAINRRQKQRYLEGMEDLLKEFTIKAPEDGMLIYRKGWDGRQIKEGSQISAWDPVVATLPDLASMNSITYVNEVDIRKIKIGQKVEIGLDAFPDKKLTGEVTRVANVGEQRPNADAKVFQVTVELDRVDDNLRPGMTTSNKIFTSVIPDAVSVPLEALHNFQDSITYIYKQQGMDYRRQEVKVGVTNANEAQILLGLTADDRVYLSIPDVETELEDIALLQELNGKRNLSPKEENEEGEEKNRPQMDKQLRGTPRS